MKTKTEVREIASNIVNDTIDELTLQFPEFANAIDEITGDERVDHLAGVTGDIVSMMTDYLFGEMMCDCEDGSSGNK